MNDPARSPPSARVAPADRAAVQLVDDAILDGRLVLAPATSGSPG